MRDLFDDLDLLRRIAEANEELVDELEARRFPNGGAASARDVPADARDIIATLRAGPQNGSQRFAKDFEHLLRLEKDVPQAAWLELKERLVKPLSAMWEQRPDSGANDESMTALFRTILAGLGEPPPLDAFCNVIYHLFHVILRNAESWSQQCDGSWFGWVYCHAEYLEGNVGEDGQKLSGTFQKVFSKCCAPTLEETLSNLDAAGESARQQESQAMIRRLRDALRSACEEDPSFFETLRQSANARRSFVSRVQRGARPWFHPLRDGDTAPARVDPDDSAFDELVDLLEDEDQKKVLRMKHRDKMSFPAIAKALETTVDRVRRLHDQAKAILRRKLGDQGFSTGGDA